MVFWNTHKLDRRVLRTYADRGWTPRQQFRRNPNDWDLRTHISMHLERLEKMIRTYDDLKRREGQPGATVM